MQLPPLVPGRILRRYQRFLADVALAGGERVTAHCPNTGAMTGCWAPGAPVELSRADHPRRKLAYTLERVDMGAGWIGVHTGRVNAVVAEAIEGGRIPALAGYRRIRREVRCDHAGGRARLDLVLTEGGGRPDVYVEVKNTTLLDGDALRFPDAVTARGRRHLALLEALVRRGHRAAMVYALNRPEGGRFAPACDVDPAYCAALARAVAAGVEVYALRIRHLPRALEGGDLVPVDLPARSPRKGDPAAGPSC